MQSEADAASAYAHPFISAIADLICSCFQSEKLTRFKSENDVQFVKIEMPRDVSARRTRVAHIVRNLVVYNHAPKLIRASSN